MEVWALPNEQAWHGGSWWWKGVSSQGEDKFHAKISWRNQTLLIKMIGRRMQSE